MTWSVRGRRRAQRLAELAELAAATDPDPGARLDKLQDAANSASSHARNVYITFLLFGLYLAIIFGSTTHEQLLRQGPVTLPLLNVGLPLFGFYWIAPALFVLLHLNLLLQLYLLSGKLHRFDKALGDAVGRGFLDPERANDRRAQLFPFPFSQMLVGRHHGRLMWFLLWLMVWLTVLVLPVVLLLMGQVRFLPYHDAATTMWQRFMVLADVLLILIFWRAIRYPGDRLLWHPGRWIWHQAKVLSLGLIALVLSFVVFTFPGGDVGGDLGDPMADLVAEKGWLARPGQVAFETFPFLQRNLVVREVNLVASWPTQGQIDQFGEDLAWQNFGSPPDLRGRDLRYADFGRSIFVRGDFRDASLDHARLNGANLQGAVLCQDLRNCAHFKGTDLRKANLGRAALGGADLQGANLRDANLQDANLQSAKLQGLLMPGADLQGADLASANLQGVVLSGANLQGANLDFADLRGADLLHGKFQGADFLSARLQGADLRDAKLQGAVLQQAGLQGADLARANLQGAILWQADLQGANLSGANLRGADLRGAGLWRIVLDHNEDLGERWHLADLRRIDRDPIEDIDAWIEQQAAKITDPARRERVGAELGAALRDDDRPVPRFPAVWTAALGVMFDPGGPIADTLGRDADRWETIDAYDGDLAKFLGELGCREGDAHTMRGMARRALIADDRRMYAWLLAARLTGEHCPPAAALPADTRSQLEQLVAGE